MFTSFRQVHEDCLTQLVTGIDSTAHDVTPAQMNEALTALKTCRSEVVQQLKEAQAAETRQTLRTFYEALSTVIDLVERLQSESSGLSAIPSTKDDTVPHGLGN
jgi:uncharacterized UPF0160 family protein